MSPENGDRWTGIRRAGKNNDELDKFCAEPYFYSRWTTVVVLIDADCANLVGCWMYQTPSFAIVSEDNIPQSCIIAVLARAEGSALYINPRYNSDGWKHYIKHILAGPNPRTSQAPNRSHRWPAKSSVAVVGVVRGSKNSHHRHQ